MQQDLENLIKATLKDGELSIGEKEVLYSKAEKYNISKEELDIYIDSLKFELREKAIEEKYEAFKNPRAIFTWVLYIAGTIVVIGLAYMIVRYAFLILFGVLAVIGIILYMRFNK